MFTSDILSFLTHVLGGMKNIKSFSPWARIIPVHNPPSMLTYFLGPPIYPLEKKHVSIEYFGMNLHFLAFFLHPSNNFYVFSIFIILYTVAYEQLLEYKNWDLVYSLFYYHSNEYKLLIFLKFSNRRRQKIYPYPY